MATRYLRLRHPATPAGTPSLAGFCCSAAPGSWRLIPKPVSVNLAVARRKERPQSA